MKIRINNAIAITLIMLILLGTLTQVQAAAPLYYYDRYNTYTKENGTVSSTVKTITMFAYHTRTNGGKVDGMGLTAIGTGLKNDNSGRLRVYNIDGSDDLASWFPGAATAPWVGSPNINQWKAYVVGKYVEPVNEPLYLVQSVLSIATKNVSADYPYDDSVIEYNATMQVKQVDITKEPATKGTYRDRITGTAAQFPANGKHTDGLFYVRGAALNENPTMVINTPTKEQIVKSGGKVIVTGKIIDADNDNVSISATLNGKVKSTVVTGTSTVKNWTLSWTADEITDSIYNTPLVITASDGNGGSAENNYIGKITIDKVKPIIKVKIK